MRFGHLGKRDGRTVAERLRAFRVSSRRARARTSTPGEKALQPGPETEAAPSGSAPSLPVKGPGRRKRLGELVAVLVVVGPLAYACATAAVSVNPGGVLIDKGAFDVVPPCSVVRPTGFSSLIDTRTGTGAGSATCTWRKRIEGTRHELLSLRLSREKTWEWTSAPDRAGDVLAERWDDLVEPGKRRELGLGPDAYSFPGRGHGSGPSHQVVFRVSNLVANVEYWHSLPEPNVERLRARALELAAGISAALKG